MPEAMDVPEERPAPRRWRWPFTWLGLLALCFLLYELTHQPALGSVAVCLKFGWEDFSTARWLLRRDPDRGRGRCCSWLYFAWGMWKTALVAFVMSVAFAAVAPRNVAGGGDALMAFALTFLTTLVGLTVSALATALAVALAWRGGRRLWLDRAVHDARCADDWPPSWWCEGRTNRLGQLLITAIGLSVVLAVLVMLFVLGRGGGVVAVAMFALSLAAPLFIVLLRESIASRVAARTPYDCWGDEEPAPASEEEQPF